MSKTKNSRSLFHKLADPRRSRLAWVLGALAIFAIAIIVTNDAWRPACQTINGLGALRIPVASLLPGQARFFCYTTDAGSRVRFVLARGQDGRIRAVLDACEQCYGFKKGYTVSGDELICRVCGNHYKLRDLEVGKASCVPKRLRHVQHDDVIEIDPADLRAAKALF